METQEALSIIQGALNERKALARVKEVLDLVMGAEVRKAELEAEIVKAKDAIEEKTDELSAAHNRLVKLEAEISEKVATFNVELSEMDEELKKVEADIEEKTKTVEDLTVSIKNKQDEYDVLLIENADKIKKQEDRLKEVESKIKEMKDAQIAKLEGM
jgi:chromosome segregation protein